MGHRIACNGSAEALEEVRPPQLAASFMSGSASRSVSHHRLDAWGAALLGSSAIRTKMASKAKPGACLVVPVQAAVVDVDVPVTVKSTLSMSNTDGCLCVPKIRFCNIDGEGRQGQVV